MKYLIITIIGYYAIININRQQQSDTFPDLSGLTYSAVGNSITECCSQSTFTYVKVIDDSTSLGTVTNIGYSGNTMARLPGIRVGFRLQVQQSYGSDIISIFGGTNDWVFNVPLGNVNDHNDTNNVSGACNYFIDLIEANSKESILFFIIPLSRSRDTLGNEIETSPVNRLGYTVEDYGNAIKAVCENRGIKYFNLYEIDGLLFSDIENWSDDGLHPNDVGQMRIGRYLKYYLENKDITDLY